MNAPSCAALLAVALGMPMGGHGATIFVDRSATGSVNGSSWLNAFTDVQSAIDAATDGDQVWIACGTYTPTSWPNGGTSAREMHFSLKNGVSVYGGFAGGETNLMQRDPAAHPTVLSGDLDGNDADLDHNGRTDPTTASNNAYHIVYHPSGLGLSSAAMLDGVTLRGGNANGAYPHNQGGAIYNSYCSPVIVSCMIADSVTGGGIWNDYSSPTISNCTVMTSGSGAGIYGNYSSPVIASCVISSNSGTGIDNYYHSSPVIRDCIVSHNSPGGGIVNRRLCSPTISRCSITDNSSAEDGGGIHNARNSSPTITDCTIARNSAADDGGGMYSYDYSSASIMNCTFVGNVAIDSGGAIYNDLCGPSFIHCTITGNSALYDGGAVRNDVGSYPQAPPTFINCVIWSNLPGVQISPNAWYSATVFSSIVQGGFVRGSNIITADPLLLPLGDYGGTCETAPVSAGSPAMDAGRTGDGITADQRGLVRDAQPDIGACEFQAAPVAVMVDTIESANAFASGYAPTLIAFSEGTNLAYQWFAGTAGDTAAPMAGGTNRSLPLFPLLAGTSFWLRVSCGGDSIDSQTLGLSVGAPIIFLSIAGDDGAEGTRWPAAKRTFQAAVSQASYGAQVWISEGTYTPNDAQTNVFDRNQAFFLRNGVSVLGGFAGAESNLSQRDAAAHPVILSADLDHNDADMDGDGRSDPSTISANAYHVFFHPATQPVDASALLDGVTIRGGNANGPYYGPHPRGGGMYNYSSSPSLVHCVIADNRASYGGGVFNDISSPEIRACTLAANTASSGGGIYNTRLSSPAIVNCTLTANSVSDGGSAIHNYSSWSGITNCTIAYNFAKDDRGSILNSQCSPAILNCILWGSSGTNQIRNESSSTPIVSSCVIQGGYPGGGNILTDDPRLMPLGDYGGPTPTMPICSGSASINAGLSGSGSPTNDQRGLPRDAQPDIGACELRPTPAGAYVIVVEGCTAFAQGYAPTLLAFAEGTNITYQWFLGTSNLIAEASGTKLTIPPLTSDTSLWLRVLYPGGAVDSEVLLLTVGSPAVVFMSPSGADIEPGTNWSTAKRTFQAAMSNTAYGAQVWVAEGTYRANDADTNNLDRAQAFALKDGVSVFGGFAGTETDLSMRHPASHPVVFSADLDRNDSDVDGDGHADGATASANAYHVFYHPASLALDSTALLDGATISGGRANGLSPHQEGGGIYNDSSSPTITNCTLVDNSASYGGGIYNLYAFPAILDCTLAQNSASFGGGAVFSTDRCSPLIAHCAIINNSSEFSGGGIFNDLLSSATITHCTVASNSASFGGGMYNREASPTISCSTLFGNSATFGGGIRNQSSPARIVNCTMAGNSASTQGGAVHNSSSSPSIAQCTVSGNSPDGICNLDSDPSIANCILWTNAPTAQVRDADTSSAPSVASCVIQGGYPGGSNIITADPLLQSLGDYGGPTPTLRISVGSPAIDAGTAGPTFSTNDQRGFPRDAQPDIGACEFQPALVTSDSANPLPIGGIASLNAYTDHTNASLQWYAGESGDTSSPVAGGTTAFLSVGPLDLGVSAWARVEPGGGAAPADSASFDIEVRGTYAAWCDFHGLSGADRSPEATPAADGIANLVKFTLGLNPWERATLDDRRSTTANGTAQDFEQNWWISRTPTDVAVDFMLSDDLCSWTQATTEAELTGSTPAFDLWSVSLLMTNRSRAFIRLRAGLTSPY